MKFSLSLVSSLLLATLTRAMNADFNNSLPFLHLLPEDEQAEYLGLVGAVSFEEINQFILIRLNDTGIFPGEAVGGVVEDVQPVAPPVPVAGPPQLPPGALVMGHNEHGHMVIQVPQGMNVNDVLGMLMHAPHHHGHHQHHHVQFGGDVQDPFTMDKDHFEVFLALPENFTQAAFNNIIATTNVNDAPAKRVFRMLLAAAEHDAFNAFSFLCGAMFKTISVESGKTLGRVVDEITKAGKSEQFLECYLEDCTPAMALDVGKRMNAGNAALHQVFVNKCGNNIPVSVVGNLVNVQLPDELARLVADSKAGANSVLRSMKATGTSSASEDAVLSIFDIDSIQIAAFFPSPEQAETFIDFELLADVNNMALVLESIKDEAQFTFVHLDKATGVVNIFKSPNGDAAPIAILHQAEAGYEASEAVQNLFLSHEAFHVAVKVEPFDIIVGCSAEMAKGLKNKFVTDVSTNLTMSFDHDSAESVMEYLQLCAVTPVKAANMLVAVVPAENKS